MTLKLVHFSVAVVCALPKELLAVRLLFDQTYVDPEALVPAGDPNSYAFGRMGQHNVVAASLPGEYGTNSAASVAAHIARTFTAIRFCLLVGIGGAVPSPTNDIRLGDVVVSHPQGTYSGVMQYDLGKSLEHEVRIREGSLTRPPRFLLGAISNLRADPHQKNNPLHPYLEELSANHKAYQFPRKERDQLFVSTYRHNPKSKSCTDCSGERVERPRRKQTQPFIHYGVIASGNQVIKSARLRDSMAQDNVLCVEMEAAGIMNELPSLVIRGICDYADSHKNDAWQEYAAATAAAYAKLLLTVVRSHQATSYEINDETIRKAERGDVSSCTHTIKDEPQESSEEVQTLNYKVLVTDQSSELPLERHVETHFLFNILAANIRVMIET
jgi:nucleoside phosphorylase